MELDNLKKIVKQRIVDYRAIERMLDKLEYSKELEVAVFNCDRMAILLMIRGLDISTWSTPRLMITAKKLNIHNYCRLSKRQLVEEIRKSNERHCIQDNPTAPGNGTAT